MVIEAEIVDGWLQAAEARAQPAPNIWDLMGLVDRLRPSDPIRARQAERQLRFLCKEAKRLGIIWDTPWE